MRLTRRTFLVASALGASLAAAPGWAGRAARQAVERRDLFPQGVASGDPDPNSVILWTRRPPVDGSSARTLVVEVASDPGFRRIVAGGRATIGAETDWTSRFLATGLEPARE